MKIKLLTLSLVLISSLSYGQFFKITTGGFINEADTSKNFYVMDHTKLTKSELYEKSLIYFNGLFASPKDVISTVQDESITLNFVESYKIVMGYLWNVNMSYTFNFKDGKVKVSAPYINKIYNDGLGNISINVNGQPENYPIYKRNGKGEIRDSDGLKTKSILEEKANTFVLKYINSLITDVPKNEQW